MCIYGSYGTVVVKYEIWWQKLIEIAHEYMEPKNPRYHRMGLYKMYIRRMMWFSL